MIEPEENFSLEISLQNKSRRFLPFLRIVESFPSVVTPHSTDSTKNVVRESLELHYVEFTTWLGPKQRMTYSIPLSISARGRYVLRQFQLHIGDFLGIGDESINCGTYNEVVVAPKELSLDRLDDLFGGFMGDVSVNRFVMEDPVLTLGYREYTGREPMKMISWVQSARYGELMVKKYDYTQEPTVAVVLNVDANYQYDIRINKAENNSIPNTEVFENSQISRSQSEQLLETCFSMARTVCSMLEKKNVKYSFTSNCILAGKSSDSNTFVEGLGKHHFYGILEHLGRATYDQKVSFEQLIEKEAQRNQTAGCILITPGFEEEPVRAINRLCESANGNLLILRATEVAL